MPILLNPARAGFFTENYRLTGIYRSQWKEITTPFKTLSGAIDLNIPTGKNKNNIFGLALMDFADKAGDGNLTTNYIEACLSYHKNFGENFSHYIGFGIMGGFASTSFDLDKLYFDEDFGSGTNTEIPDVTSSNFSDLSAGIEYNFLNDKTHFNIGMAVYHLNEPALTYFNNSDAVVFRKYVGEIGFICQPFHNARNSTARRILSAGAVAVASDRNRPENHSFQKQHLQLCHLPGGYYRVGDALIPKFRLDMGDLSFGLSYDFSTSSLANVSSLSGGPELSITFLGTIKGVSAGRIYNPRF
jgi:type IX secretion system PorP/SprF family membrane protein